VQALAGVLHGGEKRLVVVLVVRARAAVAVAVGSSHLAHYPLIPAVEGQGQGEEARWEKGMVGTDGCGRPQPTHAEGGSQSVTSCSLPPHLPVPTDPGQQQPAQLSLSLSISRRKEAKGQGQRRGKGQTTSSSFLSPLHPTRPPPPHPPADWCSAVQRSAGVVLLCYGCLLMSPVLFSLYTPQERTDGEFLAFFFLLRLLRIFDSTVRGGKKGKGKEQKYPPRICTHYHCPFCRARLQLHHII
jgi:hypothetical protein